jgi:(p)ppGpp synthase/HD superfamily hydrolase
MENIDKEIAWIVSQHKDTNHKYDEYIPYEFHLRMVVGFANTFEHLITYEPDLEGVILGAWGHDLIEDTRVSYNDVRLALGDLAADIIYACTNEKGKNREDRANDKYYRVIQSTPYATFVKLCDRMANVTYSKMTGSRMFDLYKKENPRFISSLGYSMNEYHEYSEMFGYLNDLFRQEA